MSISMKLMLYVHISMNLDIRTYIHTYICCTHAYAHMYCMYYVRMWADLHICTIFFLQTNNFTSSFSDGRILCYLVHHYHPHLLPLDRIQNETTVTQSAQELRRKENEELGNEGWEEQSGNWTTSFSPGGLSMIISDPSSKHLK